MRQPQKNLSFASMRLAKDHWNAAGLDALEIDHNWCRSVYTPDPDGIMVEYCLTIGKFTAEDRPHALAMLKETKFNPSPPPAAIKRWPAQKPDPAAT